MPSPDCTAVLIVNRIRRKRTVRYRRGRILVVRRQIDRAAASGTVSAFDRKRVLCESRAGDLLCTIHCTAQRRVCCRAVVSKCAALNGVGIVYCTTAAASLVVSERAINVLSAIGIVCRDNPACATAFGRTARLENAFLYDSRGILGCHTAYRASTQLIFGGLLSYFISGAVTASGRQIADGVALPTSTTSSGLPVLPRSVMRTLA